MKNVLVWGKICHHTIGTCKFAHPLSYFYNIEFRLHEYRQHYPDTEIGMPYDKQGFNTGVVLYDLECLRNSKLSSKILEPSVVSPVGRDWNSMN